MGRILGAASLMTATLALSLVPASSAPAAGPERAAPAAPHIPYLVGEPGSTWTIHDGATVVTLPASIVDNTGQPADSPGVFHLLGTSAHGYVVSEEAGSSDPNPMFRVEQLRLYVVHPDGTARTFYDHSGGGELYSPFSGYRAGGRVLVGRSSAEEVSWNVSGVHLDGGTTSEVSMGQEQLILDAFSARRVLATTYGANGRFRWRLAVYDLVGHTTRPVPGISADRAAAIRVGDVQTDLYGWRLPQARPKSPVTMAFARLSHPDHVLWKARFDAFSFDPTHDRLLGWKDRTFPQDPPRGPLQIRRASDGHVVATLHDGLAGVDDVAWEDRSHVLVSYADTVVRCSASGVCRQILVSPARVQFAG